LEGVIYDLLRWRYAPQMRKQSGLKKADQPLMDQRRAAAAQVAAGLDWFEGRWFC
jgi:hypothetical protein